MLKTTELISDVEIEFEGGNSLAVDWDIIIRRAVEEVLDNCRPDTLKRRVPIYGLAEKLGIYYAPVDILAPSSLYPATEMGLMVDEKRAWGYVPPKTFFATLPINKYTIEYVNGVQFIVVRHAETGTILTIDAMNVVGTLSGGTPTLNEHNFLQGSASIEATFSDAGVELGDTFATAQDISDHLRGLLIIPAYITDATKVSTIEFRLKTDDTNYFSITIDVSELIDGWNMMRANMADRTKTGSPVATNITKWSIIVTATTGATPTIIFDKITLQKYTPWFLQYFSDRPYATSAGVLWQSTVSRANKDEVNFGRDLRNVLHYEMCLLVTQAATFDAVDGQASKRFTGKLARAWDNYYERHPSDEAPLSYSKSPEIDIEPIGISRLQRKDSDLD
ncbi:MAG: hypothetical protein FVQ79_03360 [Planctomycetes bacterium]|nr:hypothetical protein [Planctomycetota bacterium]